MVMSHGTTLQRAGYKRILTAATLDLAARSFVVRSNGKLARSVRRAPT